MRKFTLIFTFVALASFIYAQNAQVRQQALTSPDKYEVKKLNHKKSAKVDLWSEDFGSGPDGDWTIVDLSNENMPWDWGVGPVTGCYTDVQPEDLEGHTTENGFMWICPDGFNSVPQYTTASDGAVISPNLITMDSYFEIGPIDLSAASGAVLEFYEYIRVYYDFSSAIWVANDYDPENPETAHWTEWISQELEVNTSEHDFHQVNISEVAAGESNVYIRMYGYGATHYVWIVDDMRIFEPFANNMRVTNSWIFYDWFEELPTEDPAVVGAYSGYLQHGGGYYKIPKDQVTNFIGAQVATENFGYDDQTNVILNTEIYYKADSGATDSVLVHSFQSDPATYEAYTWDSIRQMTEYLPEEWGHYEVHMTVEMDNADDLPEDNHVHFDFEVGDSTYSRTTDNVTSTNATRGWIGGGVDGDGLGQYYRLLQPITEVEAFRFYFAQRNEDYADLINAGGFVAVAKIFSFDEEAEDWNTSPLISSDPWTASMADTGSWITINYAKDGSNEFLQAGDYNIFIETYTSVGEGEDGTVGFYIGGDLSIKQPEGVNTLWLEGSWGISSPGSNFTMNLIHAAEDWDTTKVSVREVNAEQAYLQLGQNYPNPAINSTEIKYSLVNNAEVSLEVYDLTGKQVIQLAEGLKPAGRHSVELDVTNLESGVYYYTVRAGEYKQTRKMVIME